MIKEKLDKFIEDTLFYQDLPGLVIGVSVGENSDSNMKGFNYKKSAGYKDYITKETLEAEHIFHMASVTKLFVGTGIMLLKKEGKLELEDKLCEILQWFNIDDERYKNITIRDLMTHTSGLADVIDYGWNKPMIEEDAIKKYLLSDEVVKTKLLWPPGQGNFKYSNIGYEALGAVISKVSGKSFEEYIEENIFKALKMDDSQLLTYKRAAGSLELKDLSKVGMAMPHMKDKENHIVYEPFYPYNRAHGPSSTLTTNIYDIEKFAKAHLNNHFFPSKTYEEIWKGYGVVPNNGEQIGLSWFIREQNGYTLYGHEGNDNGFRASFWICPTLDLHIVVASNISKAPVKKINKSVFDILTSPLL